VPNADNASRSLRLDVHDLRDGCQIPSLRPNPRAVVMPGIGVAWDARLLPRLREKADQLINSPNVTHRSRTFGMDTAFPLVAHDARERSEM